MGIQWGAGGDTPAAELAAEGTLDPSWAIRRARACLDAGAELVMVESEGGCGLQSHGWMGAAVACRAVPAGRHRCRSFWSTALAASSTTQPAAAPHACHELHPTTRPAGITEDVAGGRGSWRTDAVLQLVQALGQERLMFEAADPAAFSWCGAGRVRSTHPRALRSSWRGRLSERVRP